VRSVLPWKNRKPCEQRATPVGGRVVARVGCGGGRRRFGVGGKGHPRHPGEVLRQRRSGGAGGSRTGPERGGGRRRGLRRDGRTARRRGNVRDHRCRRGRRCRRCWCCRRCRRRRGRRGRRCGRGRYGRDVRFGCLGGAGGGVDLRRARGRGPSRAPCGLGVRERLLGLDGRTFECDERRGHHRACMVGDRAYRFALPPAQDARGRRVEPAGGLSGLELGVEPLRCDVDTSVDEAAHEVAEGGLTCARIGGHAASVGQRSRHRHPWIPAVTPNG
jgi:hypothetical protein